MSDSKLFVSKASIRNLKKGASTCVPEVASSHVSEALASAMGFRTHAALLAALDGKATAEACKPSNAKFAQRLKDLGYSSVPQDLKVVPEFNHSLIHAISCRPAEKEERRAVVGLAQSSRRGNQRWAGGKSLWLVAW